MSGSSDHVQNEVVQADNTTSSDEMETTVFEISTTQQGIVMTEIVTDQSGSSSEKCITGAQQVPVVETAAGDGSPDLEIGEFVEPTSVISADDDEQLVDAELGVNSNGEAPLTFDESQLVEQDEVPLIGEPPAVIAASDISDLQALISDKPTADTTTNKPQLVFKCVPVSSDGTPDTAKTLKLNRDILKEVLEKHGFSMDPKDWPEEALVAEEDEAETTMSRKRKKKAKKMKRKKEKLEHGGYLGYSNVQNGYDYLLALLNKVHPEVHTNIITLLEIRCTLKIEQCILSMKM